MSSGDVTSANDIGYALLHLEQSWHVAYERSLNQLLWHHLPLAVAASYLYATLHYTLTPAVLVWMYRRHPGSYRAARTTLLLATLLGLTGFLLFPTTPPRLLPGGGFYDTLATVSDWGWWGSQASAPRGLGALTNQYAAMPSLHVGWAVWCGWLLVRHARHRTTRVVGALYPVLTVIVVMATANHYLLDAVAGIADIAIAAGAAALLHRLAQVPRNSPPPVASPSGDGIPRARPPGHTEGPRTPLPRDRTLHPPPSPSYPAELDSVPYLPRCPSRAWFQGQLAPMTVRPVP
jgi:hypothetical protein